MDNLGEAYCNLGMELFEAGEYEQSVQNLIKAYESGYRKEDILEHLYACFVLPNEEEFRKNYSVNCLEISQLSYEDLSLDFIPIAEGKFYIFDREKQKFLGSFELEEEPFQGNAVEFHSILYTDVWDIREILSDLREREWDAVYLVLNELESKFASFLKLPRFKELYLRKVIAFKDDQLMHTFFEYYDEFYLPKTLVSADSEKYLLMVKEIHDKRVHSPRKERTNVFLSICIPSYNRGSLALANVLRILECPYDSEIEIVVSNNGSTQDTEGYQKIRELNDARIKYHEFDMNQGYATNVIKVLEMASGDFAMLASDEESIILEHLQEFLSCIKENASCEVFLSDSIGSGYEEGENSIYKAGASAIAEIMNLNYITGITYNMKSLHKINAFKVVKSMRGNSFLELYVQIVFAMLAGAYGDFQRTGILLWDARGKQQSNSERKTKIVNYALPEARIAQLKGRIEILWSSDLIGNKDFIKLYLQQIDKTYHLTYIAYEVFDDLKGVYTWEDLCFYVYRENREIINDFPITLTMKEKEHLQDLTKTLFFEYLCKRMITIELSKEEKWRKKILHQLIKIDLEDGGDEIIRNSYQIVESLIGKEESFLQTCRKEAVTQLHVIAYLYEMYWKDIETRKNMDIAVWDA